MICPECGGKAVRYWNGSTTYIGYVRFVGEDEHEHDDNCRERILQCPGGHTWRVLPIRTCNDERDRPPACDWTGQTSDMGVEKVVWDPSIPMAQGRLP